MGSDNIILSEKEVARGHLWCGSVCMHCRKRKVHQDGQCGRGPKGWRVTPMAGGPFLCQLTQVTAMTAQPCERTRDRRFVLLGGWFYGFRVLY